MELDNTKELLAKYSIRESRVELRDIMLDKTIKIINGTAKLPSDGRKKYACTICKDKFLTSKELDKHRRTHDDDEEEEDDDDDLIILPEKPRKKTTPAKKQGKFTPKPAPIKNTIKNYFRKTEKTEEKIVRPLLSHKCETCDSNFTCVEDIKLHTSSTCRFKCGVCRKTYNTVYAFTVHVLQHKINLFNTSPAPDKQHKCSLCPESFDDYIDLKTHGILKHNVKSRTISQDEPDNSPEETNGGNTEVEITCELCFDIFESKEELNEHMEFHKELGEKPDKKVQEENSADTEESFGKLTEENSPESPEDDAGEKVVADCTTREVRVELNPIPVIESSYSLADETKPDTPPAEPVEGEEEKRVEETVSLKYIVLPANDMIPKKHYKCNKCERIYTSIEDYDSHVPTGCKIENVCPVCLVTISTNSEWYTHITEKHRRWATCKYCFETFNEIKKLDQHKAMKHFNTFKNVCKICFGSFATYEEFDEHLKKEHLNLSSNSSGKLSLNEELKKYNITREPVVLLEDVSLDKNLEFVGDTVVINEERRKKFTCYICMAKFSSAQNMSKHRALHSDSELDDNDTLNEETWTNSKNKTVPPQNLIPKPKLKPKDSTENINKDCDETIVTNKPQKVTSFKCETCDVYFESSDEAKLHAVSNKCKFFCKICGRKFNTLYAFVVHLMQHRSNAAKSQNSSNMVYKCTTCEKSFENCLLLRSHEINAHHPKPDKVPINPEPVVNTSKEETSTVVKEEPVEPPVHDPADDTQLNEICCELCYDVFESAEDLEAHMEFHKQLEIKANTIVIEDDEDEVVEVYEEKKDPNEIITTIKSTAKSPQTRQTVPPRVYPTLPITTSVTTASNHALTDTIKDMLTPKVEKQSKTILLPPVALPRLIPISKLKQSLASSQKSIAQPENSNLELRRTGPLSYSLCFKEDGTSSLGTSTSTAGTSNVGLKTNSPTVPLYASTLVNPSPVSIAPSTSSTSAVTATPNLQFFITNVPYVSGLQTAPISNALPTVTNNIAANTSSALTTSSINASNFTYVVAPSNTFVPPILVNDPEKNLAYVILPHNNSSIVNPTESVTTPKIQTTETSNSLPAVLNTTPQAITSTTTTTSTGQFQSCVPVATAEASSLPVIANYFTTGGKPKANVLKTTIAGTESTSTSDTANSNAKISEPGSSKELEESIVIDSDSSTEDNREENRVIKNSTGNESESDELVIDESSVTTEKNESEVNAGSKDNNGKSEKKKYKFPMKCNGCSVIFQRMKSMRHHLDRRHCCELCNFKCCKASDFKQHYILAHRKFFCSRCSVLADTKRSFTEHNRRNHICQECNGFFFNLAHHTCPKVIGIVSNGNKDNGKV